MTAAFVVVRSWPAREATVCEAKRCGAPIPEGAPVVLVYHEWRFIRDPGGRDVQARLCGECAGRLGANARPFVQPMSTYGGGIAEPFVYRGKPVTAF